MDVGDARLLNAGPHLRRCALVSSVRPAPKPVSKIGMAPFPILAELITGPSSSAGPVIRQSAIRVTRMASPCRPQRVDVICGHPAWMDLSVMLCPGSTAAICPARSLPLVVKKRGVGARLSRAT